MLQFTLDDQLFAKKLTELRAAARNRIVRRAITKLCQYVVKEAKRRVPKDKGLLRKSLGYKIIIKRNAGRALGIVGPRTGFDRTNPLGKKVSAVKYAHFVERGRGPSRPKKKRVLSSGEKFYGKFSSPTKAQPFLGPSVAQAERIADQIIMTEMNYQLSKLGAS
jgi:HK97 gp10 family phage protein